jgi:CHASE3 domain sensor protein
MLARMPEKETRMKAFRRNPAGLLAVALLSVGALGLSFLSLGRLDLISEPFGSLLIFGRVVGSAAALGVLYQWTRQSSLQRGYVRVRA